MGEMLSAVLTVNSEAKQRTLGSSFYVSYKGELFELTETAQEIWSALDGTRDLGAVISEVAASYDVSLEEFQADMVEWIEEMIAQGLVLKHG